MAGKTTDDARAHGFDRAGRRGHHQTRLEEIANAGTHYLALVASLVGLPFLVIASVLRGDAWQIVGATVFGIALVLLYAASTVYHALPVSRAKEVWRLLDHSAIYLVIAASYTPFALGVLRGPVGWSILATVWALAIAGILFKTKLGFRFPRASTALYLAMGWMGVLAAGPLVENLDTAGVSWLVAGGLSYTFGVVFFAWEGLLFAHALWHVFVVVGSLCHYVAVLGYAIA